jgi:hypothetical protein
MRQALRAAWVILAIFLTTPFFAAQGADGDGMVPNPHYKYWANCKPGSTVTLSEKTVFSGADKELVPDGVDEKDITTKLLSVTPDHVVVEVAVVEHDFLSTIEPAPTKKKYPAQVTKANLHAGLHGVDPKVGEDTLEVMGKKLTCVTFSGTEKKEGTEVEHKLWLSDKVPGGIVKHTRVTKQDGKVVADTTIMVKSFKME